MIHTTLDNFFLDDEALENSPSRRSGIDRDTENTLRHYGCELIQEAGILLGFQQVVMATGQVLFHRFYCKRSMKEYNVKKVAATALWQGAKLEEAPEVSGHPRELLNKIMVAVDRCILRRETADGRKLPILDLHSKESEEFRRSLIRYEIEMLKAFGFITHVEHPHKLLLNFVTMLGLDHGMEQDEAEFPGFVQEAWNLANDSLRTTLCVRYKSSIIACGIIFYVSRKLKVPLPESPPWYDIFNVQLSEIYDICAALHQLYNAPRAQFIPVCHQILPSKPPTPATAGTTAGVAVDGATPTPMLGRPGAKPLDPSVRIAVTDGSVIAVRTPRQANGATSTPIAAVVSGSTPAAAEAGAATSTPPSSAPSPQQQAPPGSAQKRKDPSASCSPALNARKRHRSDSGQHEPQQQPQAAEQAMEEAKRPPSRSSIRSRSHSRDGDRGLRHNSRRSRSRSRDRGHYRDSARGGDAGVRGDGRHDRERDRRERARDRDRSHTHSRGREHGERDRDRDRHRDGRDSREGDRRDGRRDGADRDRDRRVGADKGPSSIRGRESERREHLNSGQDKQQAHHPGGSGFPPPPPIQGSGDNGITSPRGGSNQSPGVTEPTPGGDSSLQDEQRGIGGAVQPPRSSSAGGSKPTSPVAAVPPRPKPVAVRKKHQQADGAADKSPAAEPAGS